MLHASASARYSRNVKPKKCYIVTLLHKNAQSVFNFRYTMLNFGYKFTVLFSFNYESGGMSFFGS